MYLYLNFQIIRSGGFNFQKPTSSSEVDVVEPENLTSYEVGYKGTLWNNRINLRMAAYYYDYEDLQVIKQDVVEGIGLNTFVNADSATAMGFEFEGQALVTDDLLLSGTWSYNDSEYDEFLTKDANACALRKLLGYDHRLTIACGEHAACRQATTTSPHNVKSGIGN